MDTWGRRLGCIVFCVLEIIINALEHIPHFPLLLLGRVLGGISTSLLFSAFESWMVSEHRKRGFPEAWLASTFALSSIGNGLVAVLAGVVAQVPSPLSPPPPPPPCVEMPHPLCGGRAYPGRLWNN